MRKGPFPILGRGHSGGRLLCEAYIRAGVRMGQVHPLRKDTAFFAIRNPVIHEVCMAAFRYPRMGEEARGRLQEKLRSEVERFHREEIGEPGPFGWKIGVTLFTLPVLLDAFPQARVVHLIRDGRDVMLSRLDARIARLHQRPVDRLTVFGDSEVTHFRGEPLGPEVIERYRTELELQHWITAVRFGMQGRSRPGQYLEVRYEDLCREPVPTLERVFAFLRLPLGDAAREWISGAARTDRIGKWRALPSETLEPLIAPARELLTQLGYSTP